MATDNLSTQNVSGRNLQETLDRVEERSQKELKRLAARAVREIREYDMDCDFGALADGDYGAYANRHDAEAAIAKIVRFYVRNEDIELAEAILEFIAIREPFTSMGVRMYMVNSAWRHELLRGEAGAPDNVRHEDPYAKEKEKWQSNTKLDVFACILSLDWAEWYTCEEVPIFYYPADVADAVGVHQNTATRYMREMACLSEIRDPLHEGRGQPKIVFEYDPAKLVDDGDDEELGSSWIPGDVGYL